MTHATAPILPTIYAVAGYYDLLGTLGEAYEQATSGKGEVRHGRGKPFADQPIMTITRRQGIGFPLGQIEKKADEAGGMVARGERDAAIAELRGIIVYAAAAILVLEEIVG